MASFMWHTYVSSLPRDVFLIALSGRFKLHFSTWNSVKKFTRRLLIVSAELRLVNKLSKHWRKFNFFTHLTDYACSWEGRPVFRWRRSSWDVRNNYRNYYRLTFNTVISVWGWKFLCSVIIVIHKDIPYKMCYYTENYIKYKNNINRARPLSGWLMALDFNAVITSNMAFKCTSFSFLLID